MSIHPIRNSRKDKQEYLKGAARYFAALHYPVSLCSGSRMGIWNENLVVGDVKRAKSVVICAYDTPKMRLLPYLMIVGNRLFRLLQVLLNALFWAVFVLLIARLAGGHPAIYLSAMLLMLVVSNAFFANIKNANYSTSSLLLLYQLAAEKKDVAYVLVDNSDFTSMGLRLFFSKYKTDLEDKPCFYVGPVGVGSELCLSATKSARPLSKKLAPHAKIHRLGGKSKRIDLCAAYPGWHCFFIPHVKSMQDTAVREEMIKSAKETLLAFLNKV